MKITCEYCQEVNPNEPPHEAGYSVNLLDDDQVQYEPYHICGARLMEHVQACHNEGITELHISKLDD